MTACTAQASFSGEPRQQQGRRRDGQPTPAAPSRSWVISSSQFVLADGLCCYILTPCAREWVQLRLIRVVA
eukprot:2981051-Prymnesium_polylepis.1